MEGTSIKLLERIKSLSQVKIQDEPRVKSILQTMLEGGNSQLQVLEKSPRFTLLNRDKIESTLSVPGIQGCHENALYKSFKMSPHFICL